MFKGHEKKRKKSAKLIDLQPFTANGDVFMSVKDFQEEH
jgi:hypothetical protein